jgi:hypothetical protein
VPTSSASFRAPTLAASRPISPPLRSDRRTRRRNARIPRHASACHRTTAAPRSANAQNPDGRTQTQDTKIAADLAGKEIAAQTLEAQAQTQLKIAEIGHPWEPEKLAFYVTLVFYAKCVVWDTVLGLGTTPALKGDVSVWAGLVMSCYFGKRTFENVARIIKR